MTREQQGVILFLATFLILFFFLTSPPFPVQRSVGADPLSPKLTEEGELQVELAGSVHRRGIYAVAKGESVLDALEKAGGIKDKISLPPAMLQTRIDKNCRIDVIPEGEGKGRIALAPLAPQKLPVLSIPVPINTATLEELMTLPGIGPKIAQAIIDCREQGGIFTSAEDLLRVKGIASKKLAAIRSHISVP
jgi:competence protein ComEA